MSENILKSDCPERVAPDLLKIILKHEEDEKDRKYYLKLYSDCLSVVQGQAPPKEN